jgi:hypothetical protein
MNQEREINLLEKCKEAIALLKECERALNEVPNTKLYSTDSKDTYELVSKVGRLLK